MPTEIQQHNRDEYLSTRKVPHEETERSIGDPSPVDEDDLIFDQQNGLSYHTFSLNPPTHDNYGVNTLDNSQHQMSFEAK